MTASELDDTFRLHLDGFTHGGEAVGRWDADGDGSTKAVFVPGAIPGETVTVRVTEDNRRWARAELVHVDEASPDRVTPPCPYVADCGGCDLQHVAPQRQRALKTRVVREQLQRIGAFADPPVLETRAVGPDTGYRTNAQFHAAEDGRLGFHAEGTHDVVPIDTCVVLHPDAQAMRSDIGDASGAVGIVLRAQASGARVAILAPGPGPLQLPGGDWDLALRQPDGSLATMRGDGELAEVVAGVTYRFDASSFFQVNTGGAEALVTEVMAAVGDVDGLVVWDLYSGVGLFSIPLAQAGARVTAVEGHRPATVWAASNAADNEVELKVECAAVERHLRSRRTQTLPSPDVIVLDPPRTGAGQDTAALIAGFTPARIVYVACDPAALARDAKILVGAGYTLTQVQPLDLFPMTHHVEAVATFVRS